jgi:hypothetical protein
MGERNQESLGGDALDDFFEPSLGELPDDELIKAEPQSATRHQLAEKRRRAEQRLDEKRLRDELGYYDMDFDDL